MVGGPHGGITSTLKVLPQVSAVQMPPTFISIQRKGHVGHFLKNTARKFRAEPDPSLQGRVIHRTYCTNPTLQRRAAKSSLRWRITTSLCPGPMSQKVPPVILFGSEVVSMLEASAKKLKTEQAMEPEPPPHPWDESQDRMEPSGKRAWAQLWLAPPRCTCHVNRKGLQLPEANNSFCSLMPQFPHEHKLETTLVCTVFSYTQLKSKSFKCTLLIYSSLKIAVLAHKFLNTTPNRVLSGAWSTFPLGAQSTFFSLGYWKHPGTRVTQSTFCLVYILYLSFKKRKILHRALSTHMPPQWGREGRDSKLRNRV